MDGRRFDALTIALSRTASRRQLVSTLVGGMFASLAGRTRDAAAAGTLNAAQTTHPKNPNFPFLVALPTDPELELYALDFKLTGPPLRYRAIEAMTSLTAQWRSILDPIYQGSYASTIAFGSAGAPTTPQRSITTVLFDLGTEEAAVQAHADYVDAFLDEPAVERLESDTSNRDRIVLIGCRGGCEFLSSPAPSSLQPTDELSVIGQNGRFLFDARLRDFANGQITATQGESIALLVDGKLQAVGTPTGIGRAAGAVRALSWRAGIALFAGGSSAGRRSPVRAAQEQPVLDDIHSTLLDANTLPIFGSGPVAPPESAAQWLLVDDGAIIVAFGETDASAEARQREANDVAYAIHSEQPLALPAPYRGGFDLALAAIQYVFRTEADARAFLDGTRERLERGQDGLSLTEIEGGQDQREFVYEVADKTSGVVFGIQIHALVEVAGFPGLVAADLAAVPRSPDLPAISQGELQAELGPIAGEIVEVLAGCLVAPATCPSAVPLSATIYDQPEPTATTETCPAGRELCGGTCADLLSDEANCGECGLACGASATCCSGGCVDTQSRPDHCGGCGSACRPPDLCTRAVCSEGGCQTFPIALDCPASDQCHDPGACDPATGGCTNPAKPDGAACNDGNACTQTDACRAGACVGSNPVVCTASDQCHVAGQCDPATGACSNPNAPEGTGCNDGNACTSGDTCTSGVCQGGAAVVCPTPPTCFDAVCDPVSGCGTVPKPVGAPCDDANACTIGDACDGLGACVPGQQQTCGPCLRCNTASGTCEPGPSQDGNSCPGDGNLCFGGFQCTATGACVGVQPVVCTAQDQCHVAGTCDPASGACSNPDAPDDTGCDDGDACTESDTCQAGVCVGSNPVACTALDQCHDPGTCDPGTGLCSNPPKANGSPCDDGDACTQTDSCQAGACVGGNPVVCTPLDQCHVAGQCDPASGACSNPNAPDGTACLDGSCCGGACTDTETDEANCGGCGLACGGGEGETCCAGACCVGICCAGACCAEGAASCCGGACADVLSDEANCGGCGVSCGGGEICTAGVCGTDPTCPVITPGVPTCFWLSNVTGCWTTESPFLPVGTQAECQALDSCAAGGGGGSGGGCYKWAVSSEGPAIAPPW